MAAAGNVEVDSQDVIRLVLQFLQESNLTRSMHTLQHESGVSLNSVESVEGFKADIVGGRWDKVLSQVRPRPSNFRKTPLTVWLAQIASVKLSQTKLLDLYEHITFELLEKHEYDTVRTMMKSTLALNLMKQQQPSRFSRLDQLLRSGSVEESDVFPSSSRQQHRERLAESLAQELTAAPPSRLLAIMGQALKWQQHVGVLPPGGRFDLFRGIAPALQQLKDRPAVQSVGKIRFGGALPHTMIFSPDGQRIISGNNEGFVELWDSGTRKLDSRLVYQSTANDGPHLLMHAAPVTALAQSTDGELLASGSSTGEVKVWAVSSGSCLRTFPAAHSGAVNSLAFSADCTHLLTASTDNTARIHGLRSGKTLKEFRGHASFVNSAHFVQNESQVLTGSADGTVRLWDVKGASQLRSFKPPQEIETEDAPVLAVHPLPRTPGRVLVVSRSHAAHIMSLEGALMSTLQASAVPADGNVATSGKQVVAGALSPREKFVYLVTEDGRMLVLDAGTCEEESKVQLPAGAPVGIVHHPAANTVVTWSEKDVARLWGSA